MRVHHFIHNSLSPTQFPCPLVSPFLLSPDSLHKTLSLLIALIFCCPRMALVFPASDQGWFLIQFCDPSITLVTLVFPCQGETLNDETTMATLSQPGGKRECISGLLYQKREIRDGKNLKVNLTTFTLMQSEESSFILFTIKYQSSRTGWNCSFSF